MTPRIQDKSWTFEIAALSRGGADGSSETAVAVGDDETSSAPVSLWSRRSVARALLLLLVLFACGLLSAKAAYSQTTWEYQRLPGPPAACRATVAFANAGGACLE